LTELRIERVSFPLNGGAPLSSRNMITPTDQISLLAENCPVYTSGAV